jgi:hypothetical protein
MERELDADELRIVKTLKSRSLEELVTFWNKLRKIDTPRAWGLRYYVMREMCSRMAIPLEDSERAWY